MNTQLEKLFQEYSFSPKDRYDFLQIYALLPSHKKVGVIEKFEEIVKELNILKQELSQEQEILFGETLQNIEQKITDIGKKRVVSGTKQQIDTLKHMI